MATDGITARITKAGLPVLRVHYTADANKDPRTPEGAKWYAEASQGYPEGPHDPGWRKEMEIEYGARGGQALFALWEWYKPAVVIPPFAIAHTPHAKFYGTYDHGHMHKAAYHVHAVLPDGRKFTVWEFAASQVPVRAMAEIIQGHDVELAHDGRKFQGNPFAGREVVRICDPHLFDRKGRDTDASYNSLGDLFRDKYNVHFQKGKKGGQLTIAQWLIGNLWIDPERPKYQIFDTCHQLLYELPRLKYRQITSVQARSHTAPEELLDKDDDAWDSLCHFLRLFPSTVAPQQPKNIYGTFFWYQRQVQTRKPLANSYSRL